jgi:hypothetical protein
MQRTYAFFPQDAQQVLVAAGGEIIDHSVLSLFGEEGAGLWTAQFPEATQEDECYLWTPQRTSYHRYTLPTGEILVEPHDAGDPYRCLFVLTAQMQNAYSMSRKEVLQGYPHITVNDGVKEILVPGQLRTQGETVFLDGFGTGRPGFRPLFVLFTYHPDGKREIYLIAHDEVDNPAQRYVNLQEVMPAPNDPQVSIRNVACALDSQLKDAYGIDWEREITQIRAPLSQESPPMTASPSGSDDPVIVKKGYSTTYDKDECDFALTLYGTKTPHGYAGDRILHLIWHAQPGMKWRFTRLVIEDTDMEILADSHVLRQLAALFSEDIDMSVCETRLEELGFVQEQQ